MVKPILPRQDSLLSSVDTVQEINHLANVNNATPCTTTREPEPAQPRKRGRKPGPLSRSAREAQRKLNHSIIEKARRTKINEALAALRQIVPSEFSRRPPPATNNRQLNNPNSDDEVDDDEDRDEEDDGDAEYDASLSGRKKPALSGSAKNGKKREEKEFKLEVLERTVGYLQELTQRYDELKMRHDQLVEMNASDKRHSQCRCFIERRNREFGEDAQNLAATSRKRGRSDTVGSISDNDHNGATLSSTRGGGTTDERPSKKHQPLPPISSWLPLSPHATRSTLSPSTTSTKGHGDEALSVALTPMLSSHLPTPPSSTVLQPIHAALSPIAQFSSGTHAYSGHSTIPSLSLGPTALALPNQTYARRHGVSVSPSVPPRVVTGGRSTKHGNNVTITRPSYSHSERVETDASPASPHTPEDESAASLLLTMRLQYSPVSPFGHKTMPPIQGVKHRSSSSISSPRSSGRGAPASPPTPASASFILPPPEMAFPTAPASPTITGHRHQVAVETPGSLLGLTRHRSN